MNYNNAFRSVRPQLQLESTPCITKYGYKLKPPSVTAHKNKNICRSTIGHMAAAIHLRRPIESESRPITGLRVKFSTEPRMAVYDATVAFLWREPGGGSIIWRCQVHMLLPPPPVFAPGHGGDAPGAGTHELVHSMTAMSSNQQRNKIMSHPGESVCLSVTQSRLLLKNFV